MQLDSLIPRDPTTLVYVVVASILGYVGHWLKERKRQPHELRKIDAETRQLHTTSDISPVGITLETLREIQTVIQKAEDRRDEWHQREEELRTQIRFWRQKAEELDGELVDSRDANVLLQARYKNKKDSLDKAVGLLKFHQISFGELDQPKE